ARRARRRGAARCARARRCVACRGTGVHGRRSVASVGECACGLGRWHAAGRRAGRSLFKWRVAHTTWRDRWTPCFARLAGCVAVRGRGLGPARDAGGVRRQVRSPIVRAAEARAARSARTAAHSDGTSRARSARAAAVFRAHVVESRGGLRGSGRRVRHRRGSCRQRHFRKGRATSRARDRFRRPQRIRKRCGMHRLAWTRSSRRARAFSAPDRADGVRASCARLGGAVRMSARMTPLDMPLSGVRLAEASAGTGKTFTIATLYLRLILEQGLMPEQIVVATFTRAATAELAIRLRKRLRLADDMLRHEYPPRDRDDDDGEARATRAVIAHALETNDTHVLAKRARAAELAMDTAVIGTLHAFCNRCLGEFGFETGGAPGELELLEDSRVLQQEIIEDFWRSCSTDADAARLLAETWRKPDALAIQVCDPRWRGRHAEVIEPDLDSLQKDYERLRSSIAAWDEQMFDVADAELKECFSHHGARTPRKKALRALRAWACAEADQIEDSNAAKEASRFLHEAECEPKSFQRNTRGEPFDQARSVCA